MSTFLLTNGDRFSAFFAEAVKSAGVALDPTPDDAHERYNAWGVTALPCLVEVTAEEGEFCATSLDDLRDYPGALARHRAAVAEQAKKEAEALAAALAAEQDKAQAIANESQAQAKADQAINSGERIAQLKAELASLEAQG